MAILRWVGNAAATYDTWTITVANTWASGDTVTISLGRKDLIITLGASASTVVADIAAEIAAAINATSNASPGTGFNWNYGGQQFVEFTQVVATVDSAVVTLTAVNPGEPLGLVVTEVTAGTGTATEANSVVATGPNFLNDADNYLGGALPVDNDVLYFDRGSVSALYALDYFRANNIDLDVYITGDWTGSLGLPAIRAASGSVDTYEEYRSRYFQMRGGSKVLQVLPGLNGTSGNGGELFIDLQDQATCTVSILAARGRSTVAPTISICGTTASTALADMIIRAGNVLIEPDDAPTSASKYFVPGTLVIGERGRGLGSCVVTIGKNAALHLGGEIIQDGGTLTINAPTKSGSDVLSVKVAGGACYLSSIGDDSEIVVEEGAYLYPTGSGTIVDVFCRGVLDYRRGGSKAITTARFYKTASLFAGGGDVPLTQAEFIGCNPLKLNACELPDDRQVVWSSPATP